MHVACFLIFFLLVLIEGVFLLIGAADLIGLVPVACFGQLYLCLDFSVLDSISPRVTI